MDRSPLAQHILDVSHLYRELLPILQAVQERYPESVHSEMGDTQHTDGITRLMHWVPNMESMLTLQETPGAEKNLMNQFGGTTVQIFSQANQLLKDYHADRTLHIRDALHLTDILQEKLLATYRIADAQPQTRQLTSGAWQGMTLPPESIRTASNRTRRHG